MRGLNCAVWNPSHQTFLVPERAISSFQPSTGDLQRLESVLSSLTVWERKIVPRELVIISSRRGKYSRMWMWRFSVGRDFRWGRGSCHFRQSSLCNFQTLGNLLFCSITHKYVWNSYSKVPGSGLDSRKAMNRKQPVSGKGWVP